MSVRLRKNDMYADEEPVPADDEHGQWRLPPPVEVASAVIGAALVIIGVVAVVRSGLSSPLDQPVVGVAGLAHTALLGVVEIVVGVLIALAGLTDTRASVMLCAIALGAFGTVVIVRPGDLQQRLAVTAAHGWWALAAALVLLAAAVATRETPPGDQGQAELDVG